MHIKSVQVTTANAAAPDLQRSTEIEMSLPALLLSAYLVCGVLFTMIAVVRKRNGSGFLSSFPWAAEPALFGIAMVFWPVTVLVLLISKQKEDL